MVRVRSVRRRFSVSSLPLNPWNQNRRLLFLLGSCSFACPRRVLSPCDATRFIWDACITQVRVVWPSACSCLLEDISLHLLIGRRTDSSFSGFRERWPPLRSPFSDLISGIPLCFPQPLAGSLVQFIPVSSTREIFSSGRRTDAPAEC